MVTSNHKLFHLISRTLIHQDIIQNTFGKTKNSEAIPWNNLSLAIRRLIEYKIFMNENRSCELRINKTS